MVALSLVVGISAKTVLHTVLLCAMIIVSTHSLANWSPQLRTHNGSVILRGE